MTRVFSILAAIVALAVSAAAASAGTPETAKGACHVPGFMDYTDDSCMAKPRWGSAPASALASRSGGEVVSDFAKSKSKPAGVYDHGITQGRKPPPRGTAGSTLIGEVTFPKARRAGVINSLGQKYTVSALVKNQNLAGNAPTPRTLGAGKDRGWVKPTPKQTHSGASGFFTKVLDHDGSFTGFKNGKSNTLLLSEGVVDVIERDNGRRVSPPKPSAIHENEGIDGGFKAKPPHKRRLVSHEDSEQI